MFTTRVDIIKAPVVFTTVPARIAVLLLAAACTMAMPGCLLVAAGAAGAGAGYVVANEKTRDSSTSEGSKSD
ncbi:MAG TPA: hypothetical protein VHN77_15395 [Phycisphaerales bacterium]|nr:hypothetical protein [Phycisphaerales bacterium]